MKLPRDVSGRDLASRMEILWYRETRQTGSHIRLTTQLDGEHHVTVPDHDSLRVGTLAAILRDLCAHHDMERGELIRRLFG